MQGLTHKDFIIFYILGHVKRITVSTFTAILDHNATPICSVIPVREYKVALQNSGPLVAQF